ncbi:MAG: MBL fold metallo-hydrolase [Oscillospiraceae bacterium]|nr:MBL fold metallo-hydrolase [Oscillospiraceae bacterium]
MQKQQRSPETVRQIKQQHRRLKRQRALHNLRKRLLFYTVIALLIGGFALALLLHGRTQRTPAVSPEAAVRVYFLDVGQGDAVLIESQGHAALIDGGDPDQGQRVAGMIGRLGIRKLDCIVNSHPHADHSGGLRTVLRQVPAGEFLLPKIPDALVPTAYGFSALLDTAAKQGVPVRTPDCKSRVPLGAAELEFLSTDNSAFENLNDCSLVCVLHCGVLRFLFTGDLEAAGEQAMLDAGLIPEVRVLKAAHHGSPHATSEAFLKAASPDCAVISVGAGNDYGHPSRKVLDRLSAAGCRIYRTDLDGTVCFETDGKTLSVQTGITL